MKTLFVSLMMVSSLLLLSCASSQTSPEASNQDVVTGPTITPTTASNSNIDDFENNVFRRVSCDGTPDGLSISGYIQTVDSCVPATRTCMNGSWVGPEITTSCDSTIQ